MIIKPYIYTNSKNELFCTNVPKYIINEDIYYKTSLMLFKNNQSAIKFKRVLPYWSNEIITTKFDENNLSIKVRKKKNNFEKNIEIHTLDFDEDDIMRLFSVMDLDFYIIDNWRISDYIYIYGTYINSDYTSMDDYYYHICKYMDDMYDL